MIFRAWILAMFMSGMVAAEPPAPLTQGHYLVLSADPGMAPPFQVVDFTYGPSSSTRDVSWQLTLRLENKPDSPAIMELRAVTSHDPLDDSMEPLVFRRYQLRIVEIDETLEYRNIHTNQPLLPGWSDFVRYFVPHPAKGTRRQSGLPNTCDYLGHVLTLRGSELKAEWSSWPKVKTLNLDPELLIGTSRSFKDREGQRLPQQPQRQDYHYVAFTPDDYRVMIDAGTNLFTVGPAQEPFVRDQPVFYLRGVKGQPPLRYPADLYRSNYAGTVMFMDEPTSIMIGDSQVNRTLRYFTDAAGLITQRVAARYLDEDSGGALNLQRQLRDAKIALGTMRLLQMDYPSWETVYETTWYQLAGGTAGLVHEGRYQLEEFNRLVHASTGTSRRYTAEEMFKYIHAQLRGAARHFGKDWGISIYGQADPQLSPLAMRLAYQAGARYLWYWTSDHDHHLPWPEQLELTRSLRRYASDHPRSSIRGEQPILDKVIVIPYGYFLTLESDTNRQQSADLWWVRELDPTKKNDASQRYHRLLVNVFAEVNKALDAGEEFDIAVEDGLVGAGYRHVLRITDEETP